MTDYVAEARKLRVSIVQLAQYAPDEVAATAAFAFELWDLNSTYETGDRVQYADLLYKCLTGHTAQESWTPDVSPSLWAKVLIPDPSVIPEWEQPGSTNGYSKGDKVTHNGKTWESLADNNVWEPGAICTESLWKEVA